LETKEFKEEPIPEVKPREGDGIGVIEAPRGTLYYLMSVKNDGKVRYANLVIPTAQNQINIEKDIKKLVQDNLDRGKEYLEFEIEKLMRAYDPCMSCAAHFLKVKWIE
jgi:coenzyme F420-reducing hydrogenase alpha subunit